MPTDTFYPAVDAAVRRYTGSETWQQAHDASSSTDVFDTNASTSLVASYASLGLVTRSLLSFDTSSIPDDAIVTGATITLTGAGSVTGSNGTVDLVASTQASGTAVVAADYSRVGTTLLANQIALGSWNGSGANVFTLNAAGIAALNLSGYTKFAVRHSSDRLNSSPGSDNAVPAYFSEQTGTGSDPVLSVTYVQAKTASDSGTGSDSGSAAGPPVTVSASESGTGTDASTGVTVAVSQSQSGGAAIYGDTFAGTDNTVLSAHSPSGSNAHGAWTVKYDSAGTADLRIVSNRLVAHRDDGSAAVAEYWHSDSFVDGYVEADSIIVGSSGTGYSIIGLRASGAYGSRDCYRVWLDHGIVNAGLLKLQKVVGGTITDLGSYSIGTLSGTYTIRLTATGSSLSVTVNGVARITATDSSVTGAGVGIVQLYNTVGTSTSTGVHLDNFAVYGPAALAQITDSATATETAEAGQVVTSKSVNDSATGTDASAVRASVGGGGAGSTTPTLQRAPMGDWVTVLDSNSGEYYYAYPTLIREANGNLRIVCYRSDQSSSPVYPTGTLDGGRLVTTTSSDDGATWSAASLMPCNISGVDNRTGGLLRLANGDEAYVWFTHDWALSSGETSNSATIKGYFSKSSDGWATCTAPVLIPFKFGNGTTNATQFVASSICQLQNGDLICATFGRQILNTDKWDVRYARSTDGGATWTDQGRIAAWDTYSANCVEPAIVTLQNGNVYLTFHTETVPQRSYGVLGTVGAGGAITWGTIVQLSADAANKGGLAVGPEGDLIHTIGPGNVTPFFFIQSNNNGTTWSAETSLMTGGRSLSPNWEDQWTSPAAIGAAGVDGNVGVAVGCGQGDLTQECSVFFRKLTRSGATPANPPGSDSGTGTDVASTTIGVGAIPKTATDSAVTTDTASRSAVTRFVAASDSGVGTDFGGGSTTVPNVVRIATPTSLYSLAFGTSTLESSIYGTSELVPADQHTVTSP